MRAADFDLLFVPDPGPLLADHWIARWNAKLSTAQLVESADPERTPARIVEAARGAARPVLLIGHSTGAIAAALAASSLAGADVRGAFLVAPPDDATLATLDGGTWPAAPRARLPFRTLLLASRTDPWASLLHAQRLARDWGADFVDAGEVGRIDADSGHGPWPDGLLKLGALMKGIG